MRENRNVYRRGLLLSGFMMLLFTGSARIHAAPLTLQEAVTRALERSPEIRSSEEGLKAARAREQGAMAERLPRIDFQESYLRTDEPVASFGSLLNQGRFKPGLLNPVTDPSLNALNHPDALDNFQTRISVNQPLFTGGRLLFRKRALQGQREAVEWELAGSRSQVGFYAIQVYWGLSLARESREVAGMAVETAQESLRQIELLYKEGTVVRSDLLSAKVQLADFQDQLVRARGKERVAGRAMDVLIGKSEEGEWKVDRLCPPGQKEIQGLDAEELFQLAKKKRPEYLALQATLASARNGVKAAKGNFLPNLGLEASYAWNAPRFADDLEGSYMLGLGLNWNLFKGFGDRAHLKEAMSRQEMIRQAIRKMEDRMLLEIEEARVALLTGGESLQVTRERVELAEESLRIIRQRYQEGLTTVVELEMAELAVSRSRLAWFRAIHDLRIAAARLRFVAGDLLDSTEVGSCKPLGGAAQAAVKK